MTSGGLHVDIEVHRVTVVSSRNLTLISVEIDTLKITNFVIVYFIF